MLVFSDYSCITRLSSATKMCMGMRDAEFPSLPWDSHGNGNQIA